jgi:hypothetical protein
MMSKLKISIGDLSASLDSLHRQGLIAKKTNAEEIETWSIAIPSTGFGQEPSPLSTVPPVALSVPPVEEPKGSAIPDIQPEKSTSVEGAIAPKPYGSSVVPPVKSVEEPASKPTKVEPTPEAIPETPREVPLNAPIMDTPVTPPPLSTSGLLDSSHNRPKPYPNMPAMSAYQEPAPKGIGLLTFAIGLAIATGFSVWIGTRLAGNEINRASKELVDRNTFIQADSTRQRFESKVKINFRALEEHMEKMTAKVDSFQVEIDSLKAKFEAANAPAPKKRVTRRKR